MIYTMSSKRDRGILLPSLQSRMNLLNPLTIACASACGLINHAFPAGCHANATNMDGCILTTMNKHVDDMNATIQARAVGEERTYKSADYFGPDAEEEQGVYPVEILNTLTPSGMAPHQLTLRVGSPVVFLRNLNREQGMMNGTRAIILALRPWSVQVRLTTGPRSGDSFVVPRINLTSPDSTTEHIRFMRRQLPLRLTYCMTINKAQGQTFRVATSFAEMPVS
jgi:ATP-dependent DNA helicase PIF1